MPRQNRSVLSLLLRTVLCGVIVLAPSLLHAQGKAHAQPSATGSISGNVSDHQGSPLAGAQVTLTSLDSKQTTASSTDGTGSYTFEGLKPGRYTVLFESKGLVPKTENVTVKPGHNAKVSTRLRPPYENKPKSVE